MSEHGKIIVADFEDGYAHAAPCDHAWRLKDGDTVRMFDPCPVCAEVKAARVEGMEAAKKAAREVRNPEYAVAAIHKLIEAEK